MNRDTWNFFRKDDAIIPGHCRKKSGHRRKFYFTFLFSSNKQQILEYMQGILKISGNVSEKFGRMIQISGTT